ncbi:hypothetical protein L2737_19670 [Shewanella electrodiphila]|uniref:C2H2-type domain-containing protein n=1 Tax=Shewanella electrodiphila TaxID=934143 RepID=A0ABT0KUQ0_9GAMM|nr:hypothetical protein [Shewanella electrodiphila]MCL1047524.1 hypothetical protein [Shewanella electrodiphila]
MIKLEQSLKPTCPFCAVILKDEKRLAAHVSSKCPKSPQAILHKKLKLSKTPSQKIQTSKPISQGIDRDKVDRFTYVLKKPVPINKNKTSVVYLCPHCRIKFASEEFLNTHISIRCTKNPANKKNRLALPKQKVKRKKSKKVLKKKEQKLTQQDASNLKQALAIKSSDPVIAAYLANNPLEEQVSPFGLPQDKYRRSAYGRHGMEYDSWSRNSK